MMNKISVNVAVVGRFHAFDLAKQLQDKNMLGKLLTTYPKFVAKRWEIEKEKLLSEVGLEFLRRYQSDIPLVSNKRIDLYVHKKHANNARKLTKNCDVFIGWSDSSLEALIEAKKNGITTVLERGSSHCSYWRQVLSEEFFQMGEPFDLNHKVWQRELLEYEIADYISVPSTFVERTFIDRGVPKEKLLVNAYGVDLNDFQQVAKEDGVFRIISVGGLTIRKGSRYLLQAFHELNLPDAELWHVGSVSEQLRPFIKQFETEKVKFLGHKPQNELYKYYSQGSVFVIASLEEGMAMVQCQAMACGLPLICTTNTGGADLISDDEEAGYVVPIRDVEALKARILYLYENQDRCAEMGQMAKQRISSGFTWDDYGDRYAANLERIVSKAQ